MVTKATTKTTTKSGKVEKVFVYPLVRLIIILGARSQHDNNAFFYAANNVIKDYKKDLTVKQYFVTKSMKEFINIINSQLNDNVQSLDIFCHGSAEAIYSIIGASRTKSISKDEALAKKLASNMYRDKKTRLLRKGSDGYAVDSNNYVLSDLNLKCFTNESKIEIHGCNTASDDEWFFSNFCQILSELLYKAGKTRSVVVGHKNKSVPNVGGTKVVTEQDYRHGLRGIYNNGKEIATTKMDGRLSANFIQKALDR